MNARTILCHSLQVIAAMAVAISPVGCEQQRGPDAGRAQAEAGALRAALTGTVTIGGSSTMLPISRIVADAFEKQHQGVKVVVEGSGTGAGFKKFCAGQLDATGASRPINAGESRECSANRIEFIEMPVAFDSLSVVVHAGNSFVECLTVAELKRMWEPAAEGRVTRWNQIRSNFPNQPLTLFGPGAESGTFDYFTLAIVGTESMSRHDYTKSDDDEALADGVAADANALGYFGYAYYAANKERLKLVSVDGGSGCIAPTLETVTENRYQPLARPIFIYVSKSAAIRPEVKALAHFYVAPENARFATSVGDMPLPIVALLSAARRLDKGVTGSVFGGHGSVVGVTADVLQDEDKIKNALVR